MTNEVRKPKRTTSNFAINKTDAEIFNEAYKQFELSYTKTKFFSVVMKYGLKAAVEKLEQAECALN